VDISELLKFHKSHGKIATVTTVRPISRFGVLDLKEDGTVERFREKPQADGWINAGFFVFEPAIFNYLNQNSVLETDPLSTLAKEGQLVAFKHEGFWQPMDTFRELTILNEMWETNSAPWKVWK
jgi:glucose-1-phosphate cytidylyltransferase